MPPKTSIPVKKAPVAKPVSTKSTTATKGAPAPRRAGAAPPPKRAAAAAPKPKPKEEAAAKPVQKEENATKEPESPAKHITIGQKQIAAVLIEDKSGDIKKEGKAVLVIDNENHIGARFLPYSGGNVLEACDPAHMNPERIRMGVMGAIRFGKPVAIDFGDAGPGMLEALTDKFDAVQKGLLEKCMNRDVCKREVYESLLKDTDAAEMKVESYYDFENDIAAKYVFIIIMKNDIYPKDYTNQFYSVTIDQQ